MDDLCEFLLYVGQTAPKSLEGLQLEEILVFMVVFMGSPGYVKNPFVRSRIAEVYSCPPPTPIPPFPVVLQLRQYASASEYNCSRSCIAAAWFSWLVCKSTCDWLHYHMTLPADVLLELL